MRKTPESLLLAIAAVLFSPQVWAQGVAAETPQSMLSAQIRIQGFTCDKALGATGCGSTRMPAAGRARGQRTLIR